LVIRLKIKIIGIQLKFLIALIFSILLSYILLTIAALFYGPSTNNSFNYTHSSSQLKIAYVNISSDLSQSNIKDIKSCKKTLGKYESYYSKYNLGFVILDNHDKTLYKTKKIKTNYNLESAYINTMNIFTQKSDVKKYYNFAYKIPVKIHDQIFILWLVATPLSNPTDANLASSMSLVLPLSILIFYIITFPRIRYIKEICTGLNKIANGNLKFRIRKRGRDELTDIAKNINYMAENIQRNVEHEKELEDSKQTLITNMAHDLRSPLTSIIGFLQMVLNNDYNSSDEMNKFISTALRKSENMKILTDDLFMFTKLNSSDIKLNFTSVCINELTEQIIDEFYPIFIENNLELKAEISGEKLLVPIDISMFMRVINNLFSNALKYSEKHTEVKFFMGKSNNNVKLSISNVCYNLTSDTVDKLFKRFYRSSSARSNPDEDGSGLGLSIVKSIIEHHSGTITAEYNNNIIIFTILLPI
jgi:signal transduction histidine kinase